jgi:hypothetical protein
MTKTNRKFRPYERREAITPIEYGGLQQAYDHFNATLFGGKLPDVFITYQRRAHSAVVITAGRRFAVRVLPRVRHLMTRIEFRRLHRSDQQIVQTLVPLSGRRK